MLVRQVVRKTWHATGGALLATLVLTTVSIAVLPVRAELAFAIGAHAVIPIWVALACVLPLLASRP